MERDMRDISNKENKNTGEEGRPGVETVLTGSDAAEPRHHPGHALDRLGTTLKGCRQSNRSQVQAPHCQQGRDQIADK